MSVLSTLEVLGGQPRMAGHRLSVGKVVSGVRDNGVLGFAKVYFSPSNVAHELNCSRDVLDYCAQQKCISEAIRPCVDRIKANPQGYDFSKAAAELRLKYFGEKGRIWIKV